jgi:hypothetical protein
VLFRQQVRLAKVQLNDIQPSAIQAADQVSEGSSEGYPLSSYTHSAAKATGQVGENSDEGYEALVLRRQQIRLARLQLTDIHCPALHMGLLRLQVRVYIKTGSDAQSAGPGEECQTC